MLEKQGGVCAICGKEETSVGRVTKRRQPLSVDHEPTNIYHIYNEYRFSLPEEK